MPIISKEGILVVATGSASPALMKGSRESGAGRWSVDMAGKKVLKARPKIHIADAAIRNAVLMDDSLLIDPVEMGKIVETAVVEPWIVVTIFLPAESLPDEQF